MDNWIIILFFLFNGVFLGFSESVHHFGKKGTPVKYKLLKKDFLRIAGLDNNPGKAYDLIGSGGLLLLAFEDAFSLAYF